MPDAMSERPAIRRAVSADELTRLAGLIGLVSGTLAVSGTFATAAYLSAWDLPPVVVRLDLLTAALRSETVMVQSLLLAFIVNPESRRARRDRVPGRRRGGDVALAGQVGGRHVTVGSLATQGGAIG